MSSQNQNSLAPSKILCVRHAYVNPPPLPPCHKVSQNTKPLPPSSSAYVLFEWPLGSLLGDHCMASTGATLCMSPLGVVFVRSILLVCIFVEIDFKFTIRAKVVTELIRTQV